MDPNHAHISQPPPDDLAADILIGRLVDGEADHDDRTRFDEMASINSSLWKRLALRQQDAAALTARFEEQTQSVDSVELPAVSRFSTLRISWPIAFTGWAALLVLAILWGVQRAHESRTLSRVTQVVNPADSLTPEEHLRAYLNAPYVSGELPPTLLQSERLNDGRTMIRILRRVEEIAFVNTDPETLVDENGHLVKKPAEFHHDEGSHERGNSMHN
jgi:hypothetical protein